MVEYDVDVVILRPKNPARAERVLLYDVVNRGMRLLSMFSGGEPGDGLLLRRGYTLVWSGWQGDLAGSGAAMLGALPPGMTMPKPVAARFPIATISGQPITGPVSTEMIFDSPAGDRIRLPYAAATLDQPGARLTVRAVTDGPARDIASGDWRFLDDAPSNSSGPPMPTRARSIASNTPRKTPG